MTYSEFKTEYKKLFDLMMSYPLEQAGSKHYAEKLADLEDNNLDYADKFEDELCEMPVQMKSETNKEICPNCNSNNTEPYILENTYMGDVDMWCCDDCGETWQDDE